MLILLLDLFGPHMSLIGVTVRGGEYRTTGIAGPMSEELSRPWSIGLFIGLMRMLQLAG